MNFLNRAREIEQEIISMRRELHQIPEESMKEYHTTDIICRNLDKIGIPYKRLSPTGVVGWINGKTDGKTIALRADMDALSMKEDTDLPFCSKNDGFMHACGHDTHMSMLIGAATILNSIKDELPGKILLLFQPGEETGDGAKTVLRQGVLDEADSAFAIHIGTLKEKGLIEVASGISHAAADRFRISVHGKSAHAAKPHLGHDALLAACAIVMSLQQMVSRLNEPLFPLVVTVGKLESGTRFNNGAGEAVMEGTCRCYDPELHRNLAQQMRNIVENIAKGYGCEAELEYTVVAEPLVNDSHMTQIVRNAALTIAENSSLVTDAGQTTGAEDFGDYSMKLPCGYAKLYTGGGYPIHSEKCVFDESVLYMGTALHCQVAWDYLHE